MPSVTVSLEVPTRPLSLPLPRTGLPLELFVALAVLLLVVGVVAVKIAR